MAESAVFGLASKVLYDIASPILQKAYEESLSIWEARDGLDKLRVTIETIVAVLLDAEKKQEGFVDVRNWIKRLKGVLYDADDLFDEVATEELLKQQSMKKGNNMLFKKVQVYSLKLNPIISRNSIANKVKAISKRLIEISKDMAVLGFVRCDSLEEEILTGMRIGQDSGSFIDSDDVIDNKELSKLGQSHEDGIIPVLKLRYNHLPSYLKQCFASCSLFRKGYSFHKLDLIHHWIAQGYIISHNERQTLEDVSHSYFMSLVRRGFFQEVEKEIQTFEMHDLIYDLAQHVAGEETIVLTRSSDQSTCPRHVSVEDMLDDSWTIPEALLKVVGVRSFMFMNGGSINGATLNQLFASYKLLRTLSLRSLGIEEVPSCIGELKHLRNIDLSNNNFERLPDSITNLVNLLTLVVSGCSRLRVLPDIRKLMNLRHLSISSCGSLEDMPRGIEELTCLQYLWGSFKVGAERSELVLSKLQLRGSLAIVFKDGNMNSWDGDKCLQLPETLQSLYMDYYPGIRIPCWTNGTTASELTLLQLHNSCKLKYLPPLSCLPSLKNLSLEELFELEYVEEEGSSNVASTFFPHLEKLNLGNLPKLKGWRKNRMSTSTSPTLFPSLIDLKISDCQELKSIPLCPRVQFLYLTRCEVLQHLLSTPSSLRHVEISLCKDLEIMDLTSAHIGEMEICYCEGLTSFKVEGPTSLRSLVIDNCEQLKDVHITQAGALEELRFESCPELKLWEQNVDWDSLLNLSSLRVRPSPPSEMLPDCLRQRLALGKLKING